MIFGREYIRFARRTASTCRHITHGKAGARFHP